MKTEAAELLCRIIQKIDFENKSVQNIFRASIPKWDGDGLKFMGLQPLVLRGLLSTVTQSHSIKLLHQIALVPCDDIFHPQANRFVANLVNNTFHSLQTNKEFVF
jgi:hypothetical protein